MRFVDKPWGHEEIWAETPAYVGKILTINPGHKLSRQYHNLKEETFRVLEGILTLEIGDVNDPEFHIMHLYDGDSFHCPPKTIHRMICHAGHEKAVKVLEVSTNHLDDVIRLEDDYKR
jgi:mannose-6-phosphate isomerase-like protein (cupin superfamily)